MRRTLVAAAGCVAIALTGCASTQSNSSTASSSSSGSSDKSKAEKSCGSKATDDCTPNVTSTHSVRVDALVWRIRSAETASSIGDASYGLDTEASGVFVIVKLKVHSDRDDSATLTDNVMKLDIDGNTYDADNDGTAAEITSDEKPFLLDTIGPDSDRNGIVVFDVPKSKIGHTMKLRFGELGFGETHGYIQLPALG